MNMFLHILPDSLYSDFAIIQFEKFARGKNIFTVWGEERPLKYITSNVTFINEYNALEALNTPRAKAIFVHKMTEPVVRILPRVCRSKTVFWIPWGADYYETLLAPLFAGKLLLPLTKTHYENSNVANHKKPPLGKRIKSVLGSVSGYHMRRYRSGMSRIDVVLGLIENEMKMILDINPWFCPKIQPWGYPHRELNNNNSDLLISGGDIAIGNSCSVTNNHLDAFELISKKTNLLTRKIYCPLSYGDMKYGDFIEREGRIAFGDSFIPMRTVLPKEHYNQILSGCGFVFYFNQRQEAVGNILARLSSGARVFLAMKNPVLTWLRSSGVEIDCIEELENHSTVSGKRYEFIPLSASAKARNREIVIKLWGVEKIDQYTKNLIDSLDSL